MLTRRSTRKSSRKLSGLKSPTLKCSCVSVPLPLQRHNNRQLKLFNFPLRRNLNKGEDKLAKKSHHVTCSIIIRTLWTRKLLMNRTGIEWKANLLWKCVPSLTWGTCRKRLITIGSTLCTGERAGKAAEVRVSHPVETNRMIIEAHLEGQGFSHLERDR